jgi:dihydrodipicolinate synthase/N-acetylneuraminate lyase
MNAALGGVIPILPTPFTAEGVIDDEGFAKVIDAALRTEVSAVAMFGLASEYYKLADAEREHLTRLLIRHVANRCPVIISITPHSTQLAVAEAVRAADCGADALMLMPPFFMGTPIPDVISHIRAVATSVSVPVIVQYAPLQTGRAIDASVFASLCREIPNISHIKVDLVPSGPLVSALAANHVNSLVGYMGLHLIEDFERGAGGVMPTVSIAPALVRIWHCLTEDRAMARELHVRLLPFLNFVMQSVEFLIACEKELLVDAGILDSAFCRAPAYTLDPTQRKELQWHRNRLGGSVVQSPCS